MKNLNTKRTLVVSAILVLAITGTTLLTFNHRDSQKEQQSQIETQRFRASLAQMQKNITALKLADQATNRANQENLLRAQAELKHLASPAVARKRATQKMEALKASVASETDSERKANLEKFEAFAEELYEKAGHL